MPLDLRDRLISRRYQVVVEASDAPARSSSGQSNSGDADADPWAADGPGGHSDEPPPS